MCSKIIKCMYLYCIWIKNCNVFLSEKLTCILIEIWKSNVFDLDELYLIPKCVLEPNPGSKHECRTDAHLDSPWLNATWHMYVYIYVYICIHMQTIQNLYSLYNSIHTINNGPSIRYVTSRTKVCIITKNSPKSMKTCCLFCIACCTFGRGSWREPSLFQFRLKSFQLCCQCRLDDPMQCLRLKETHVNYKIYIVLQSRSVHYWPVNKSLGKLWLVLKHYPETC